MRPSYLISCHMMSGLCLVAPPSQGFGSGGTLCASSKAGADLRVFTDEVLAVAPAPHARQRLARRRSMMLRVPREPYACG